MCCRHIWNRCKNTTKKTRLANLPIVITLFYISLTKFPRSYDEEQNGFSLRLAACISNILYFTAYLCRQLVYKGMRFFFSYSILLPRFIEIIVQRYLLCLIALQGQGPAWLPKSPRLRVVFCCQTLHRCA